MSAISLTLGTKTTKQLLEVDMNVPEDKIVALREGTKYWFTNGEEKNKKIRERFHLAKNVHITVTPDAGIDRQHINVVVVQVIDVYHCPGSCMFVFFVYPFENDRVGSPFVYAYTGDYFYKPGQHSHDVCRYLLLFPRSAESSVSIHQAQPEWGCGALQTSVSLSLERHRNGGSVAEHRTQA